MTHSPAYINLFCELFPEHKEVAHSELSIIMVVDCLTPEAILNCKTIKQSHYLATRQIMVNRLRRLDEQDKLHSRNKVN